jgi:transposase
MRAFEFFGGVTEVVVPDNLKSAVTHPSYYEPDLNPTYRDLGEHYGVAIIPARRYRAKDKAKVEVGVQVVQRWIVAALRKRKFFSLDEVNQAIAELLVRLNQRPFRKRQGSRASLFAQLDQPALKPLPATRYQFGQWKTARVNIDYHIELERHYYSVPCALVHQQVDAHLTAETLEVLHRGVRVASHVRSYEPGTATTLTDHMPKAHQRYVGRTPSRLMEEAARRALRARAYNFRRMASIRKNQLDRLPGPEGAPGDPPVAPTPDHENIRGADYFDSPPEADPPVIQ